MLTYVYGQITVVSLLSADRQATSLVIYPHCTYHDTPRTANQVGALVTASNPSCSQHGCREIPRKYFQAPWSTVHNKPKFSFSKIHVRCTDTDSCVYAKFDKISELETEWPKKISASRPILHGQKNHFQRHKVETTGASVENSTGSLYLPSIRQALSNLIQLSMRYTHRLLHNAA